MSRLEELWDEIGWRCVPHGLRDCDSCGMKGDCEDCPKWERIATLLDREHSDALALLRAIWHSEGPDKWPDPVEFRRRVEALVGPPPPGPFNRPREQF